MVQAMKQRLSVVVMIPLELNLQTE